MRVARRSFVIILLLAQTACVIVPLSPRDSPFTRQNVGNAVPASIVPGVTTRAEVLLAFGEPDAASGNERHFTYARGAREGGWFLAACGFTTCAGGSSERMIYDRLIISFDDGNRVVSARHDRVSCREGSRRGPCTDVSGQDLWPTEAPNASAGAELFPRATWYSGVKLGAFTSYPPTGAGGTLVVGESSILFYSAGAGRESPPILAVPYSEVTAIDIARNILLAPRALVVTHSGGKHESFAIDVKQYTQESDTESNERAAMLAKLRWEAAGGK